MTAGHVAALPAPLNCRDCGYVPQRIDGDKYACRHCGLVQWDAVRLVQHVFPGAVLLIASRRARVSMIDHDSEIERMVEA